MTVLYKKTLLLLIITFILSLIIVFSPLLNFLFALIEIDSSFKKSGAIIILSSGQYDNTILQEETYQRIFHAYQQYRAGFAKKIFISGGVLIKGNPPISIAMKDKLISLGIAEHDIITETLSQNTFENINYLIPLLRSNSITTSILVTSSYHMLRSMAVCHRLNVNVYPAPVPCYEKNLSHYSDRIRHAHRIIREYGAIVYFWIKGFI